jgi:hypothetical protein
MTLSPTLLLSSAKVPTWCIKRIMHPTPDSLEKPSGKGDIPLIRHDAGSKELFRNG